MTALSGFLTQYANLVSLLFSAVVTAATVTYVVLTRQLARETRELRRAGSEPRISIFAEPSLPSVTVAELVIENVGTGAAYDVRFELHDEWQMMGDKVLSRLALIRHGVRYMAPRHAFRFPIGMGPEIANRQNRTFDLTVSYKSLGHEEYIERFSVSLDHFIDMSRLGRPADQRIADSMEKLSKAADHWSDGFRKLHVELWTQKDIRQRDVELRALWESQQREATEQPALPPAEVVTEGSVSMEAVVEPDPTSDGSD